MRTIKAGAWRSLKVGWTRALTDPCGWWRGWRQGWSQGLVQCFPQCARGMKSPWTTPQPTNTVLRSPNIEKGVYRCHVQLNCKSGFNNDCKLSWQGSEHMCIRGGWQAWWRSMARTMAISAQRALNLSAWALHQPTPPGSRESRCDAAPPLHSCYSSLGLYFPWVSCRSGRPLFRGLKDIGIAVW